MRSRQFLPQARTDQLVVQTLPDETLIYDLKSHKAHCLNEAATLVWHNCDGQKTISEMTTLLEEKMKVPVDPGVVWFTLERLEKAELLRNTIGHPPGYVAMSRRELVKGIGIGAAMAAPLLLSLIAPEAVQALSCGGFGAPCPNGKSDCCAGCECTGEVGHKTCNNCN
jgi:hypothetical protein